MGERSAIEWTDATWNPTTGCTKVSAGCDNCYAYALAHSRLAETYRRMLPIVDTTEKRADPFAVRWWEERLNQPERWPDRKMIFVNSMSDLFHAEIPEKYLRRVFEVMLRVDWHIYQVLTKRPARAVRFFRKNRDMFPTGIIPGHIWIGTSVENQDVDHRIRHLRALPATVRFLSCEPLLGPLRLNLEGIHWVIVGGESGVEHRPMKESWALTIRDQCNERRVPLPGSQYLLRAEVNRVRYASTSMRSPPP